MADYNDPLLRDAIAAASAEDQVAPPKGVARAAVLYDVFFESNPRWFAPFAVMLILSAGVAVLGLSQNSAATVIGAMVIAPLGSPIVALGGALALGWPRETLRLLLIIGLGALVVVCIGYALGLLMPPATPSEQLLARTTPDLRDLGVAALAGAAGAYCRTKSEFASLLVGVAIAVALVPPLASVGILLEDGRPLLAKGAFVLFATNLVGISLAVAVVMLITGYAPRPRLPRRPIAIAVTFATVAGSIAVLVPLSRTYVELVDSARRLTGANQHVAEIVRRTSGAVVQGVHVDGDQVNVDIAGLPKDYDREKLKLDLASRLGPATKITLTETHGSRLPHSRPFGLRARTFAQSQRRRLKKVNIEIATDTITMRQRRLASCSARGWKKP